MARQSKEVRLYQDIQQNPELRKINAEVNQINRLIASMGRSQYFQGISLPEQINKFDMIENAKTDFQSTAEYLSAIEGALSNLWESRRSEKAVSSAIRAVKSAETGEFYQTINILPSSSLKRSEKTSRGQLSEKAVSNLLQDDIIMLRRLTKKSDSDIIEFLNLWYESPEVSGGMTLENFVDAQYQIDYSGQGASQSWGSSAVKKIISDELIESDSVFEEEPDEFIQESIKTEQKMSDELWQAYIKLFNISV